MKTQLILCLILTLSCLAGDKKEPVPVDPPNPLTYEAVRAWHKAGGLDGYPWPKEHKADLNDDHSDEIFLGVRGFGRGMDYALFTKTREGWKLLSEGITGSHHEPEVLPEKHAGWHDFTTLHRTGRGGLWETTYTWNGKQYVEKAIREITEKELFPERAGAAGARK